jgi:hypothetical protein
MRHAMPLLAKAAALQKQGLKRQIHAATTEATRLDSLTLSPAASHARIPQPLTWCEFGYQESCLAWRPAPTPLVRTAGQLPPKGPAAANPIAARRMADRARELTRASSLAH